MLHKQIYCCQSWETQDWHGSYEELALLIACAGDPPPTQRKNSAPWDDYTRKPCPWQGRKCLRNLQPQGFQVMCFIHCVGQPTQCFLFSPKRRGPGNPAPVRRRYTALQENHKGIQERIRAFLVSIQRRMRGYHLFFNPINLNSMPLSGRGFLHTAPRRPG